MLLAHTTREPVLYLPDEAMDGTLRTTIDIPGFSRYSNFDVHRGGRADFSEDDLIRALRDTTGHGAVGLLRAETYNHLSGDRSVHFGHNVEMDGLINNMLKLIGSVGASSTLAQYLAIDTATATAVMSGSTINTASGAQTAIAVVSGGAAAAVSSNASTSFIAAASNNGTGQNVLTPGGAADVRYGTGIIWTFGVPANTEYVSGTISASSATSINITSYTVAAGKSHAAGDYVVAGPSTEDNPSVAPAGVAYSPSQAATYTTGAGIGFRKAQLQYVFPTTTTAAAYTGVWVISAASWATNCAMAHMVTSPKTIDSNTTYTVTYLLAL